MDVFTTKIQNALEQTIPATLEGLEWHDLNAWQKRNTVANLIDYIGYNASNDDDLREALADFAEDCLKKNINVFNPISRESMLLQAIERWESHISVAMNEIAYQKRKADSEYSLEEKS